MKIQKEVKERQELMLFMTARYLNEAQKEPRYWLENIMVADTYCHAYSIAWNEKPQYIKDESDKVIAVEANGIRVDVK